MRWLVPFWRGSPKQASHTLARSTNRTPLGLLRNALRSISVSATCAKIPIMILLNKAGKKKEIAPRRCSVLCRDTSRRWMEVSAGCPHSQLDARGVRFYSLICSATCLNNTLP